MAEPRAHEPKLKALAAYHAGALGQRARVQVERHLKACGMCRTALLGLGRYEVLLESAREVSSPRLDWRRVDAALAREAAARSRETRRRGVVWPLAFAAAIAAALWLGLRPGLEHGTEQARPAPRQSPHGEPKVPETRALAVRPTAWVGEVRAYDDRGEPFALTLDAVLREGFRLETGAGAELHLALEQAAAVRLAADTALSLGRAREGDVEVALQHGRLISAVRPLPDGARYAVAAAGYSIEVRGTLFSVDASPEELAVQVDEGAVAVLRDGVLLAEVRAPGRWSSDDTPRAEHGEPLRRPRSPDAGFERWPELVVPAWPRVVDWEVDGTRVGASGELRMRVPPGAVDVTAWLEDGQSVQTRITLDPVGARFDPAGLDWPAAPKTPTARGVLAPDQAAVVIRAAQPELQRCYERSLRQEPGGALKARMRLRIDAQGRVRSVQLEAEQSVPALLRECVQAEARRWQFPPPGGSGITFEAPMAFRTRM
jgi:ferric-dicitrate binding protein FerR (iron transport regulator)